MNIEKAINDYIYENEKWHENNVICPYCGMKQEDLDPQTLYSEQESLELECEFCYKTFFLDSGTNWWYTTTPKVEEVKNILEQEEGED